MAYDFDLKDVAPIIQGLLISKPQEDKPIQPLPLLTEQPIEQPPQEQRGGTEMVNAAMENAMPQAPNPYALNMKRDIVQAKKAYDNAQTDEQRATAQTQANFLRDIASTAGIDLSGYGADVSYSDAYKNLYSQQAQALMAALQGQYARNSERYYTDKFLEGIELGMSPRRARKAAELLTGNYKSDRAQYLDGLLNSYGRDGLVTNEYGNQIIGELAGEDPQLASFYAQIYPNAKDAFSRYNALEDKDIAQRNALEQLAVGNQYDLGRIKAQTAGNLELANNNFRNTLQRDEIQHGYDRENARDQYGFQYYLARNQGKINAELKKLESDLARGNATYLKDYELALQDKAFRQKVAQFNALADYFGRTGEDKETFVAAGLGIKMPDEKTGKFDAKSVDNAKKYHDMLDNDEKNVLKQIEQELDPQKADELNAKLADIRALKRQIEEIMGEQLGVQGGVQEFSDDEAANNETLAYLWNQAGGNADTYRQYVSNWLDASGVTSRFKEEYLKNLKTPQ